MLKSRKRKREPIPGYSLVEPLGRGGFGEVWKCTAPGGLFKAIKFIVGDRALVHDHDTPATEELKAIEHIRSLRHPFLLSIERVEWKDGELVIVMELADKSWTNVFQEHREKGASGIPRDELLRYLHEAADVLDFMNLRHGLQHLDIKPGNLFLVSNHVKVADFGLVRSLAEARAAGGGKRRALGLTARYAAPEIYRNSISTSCDQYSLAIVYQELLTGTRPFHGKNARQLMMQHCTAAPDLSALPETDREVVARALSKELNQRYPSCAAFVQALEASGKLPHNAAPVPETICPAAEWGQSSERRAWISALVAELMVETKKAECAVQVERLPAASPSAGALQDRFPTRLSAANLFAGLEAFRRQWNAQVLREAENGRVFLVPFPSCFWKRWLEGTRGLLVEVNWIQPHPGTAALPELSVRVGCADKKNTAEQTLVYDVGPLVLDSLRSHLDAYPERRTQERVAWPHPIRAAFLLSGCSASARVDGKGKDLSLGGMGLYLPRAFPGAQVQLELRGPSLGEPVLLYGDCVRVQRCSDGWFETGVLF